jgi:glucose-6-phosphate isomerase
MGNDARLERGSKMMAEMEHVFLDESARQRLTPSTVVYAVEYWKPVADGTEGGLFWGNSTVLPGVVGEEYFMTRGHFHARRNRAEYYATVSGSGLLVLMDEQRHGAVQPMHAGTTHYIPGGVAHRVVNTGVVPLTFLACWPSDAGYDYATIEQKGFSLRVFRRDGRPEVVAQP